MLKALMFMCGLHNPRAVLALCGDAVRTLSGILLITPDQTQQDENHRRAQADRLLGTAGIHTERR